MTNTQPYFAAIQNTIGTLSSADYQSLKKYQELIVSYSNKTNLVSSGDLEKFWSRHIIDSLQIIKTLDTIHVSRETYDTNNYQWADMGSGAGLPIIPLSIILKNIQFTAIEPRAKRSAFLKIVKQELQLNNLRIVTARTEDSQLNHQDFVSSRALGTAAEDWKLAQGILKSGGLFITLKKQSDLGAGSLDWNTVKYKLPEESEEFCVMYRRS